MNFKWKIQYGASICLRNCKNIAIFLQNKFHWFGITIYLPNQKTFCEKIFFLVNWFGAAIYAPFWLFFWQIFRLLEKRFGYTIVSSNLSPGGDFSVNVANFAKPLWNIKPGGAFAGPKEHIFAIWGDKKLLQTLRFIRFERKWRPWTPRARKSIIWTTNSKPGLNS